MPGADRKGKQVCHIEPCRNIYKFVYQALPLFDMPSTLRQAPFGTSASSVSQGLAQADNTYNDVPHICLIIKNIGTAILPAESAEYAEEHLRC
jgi:hypothetical protein